MNSTEKSMVVPMRGARKAWESRKVRVIAAVLLLTLPATIPVIARAQVDPEWLRSWNEAWAARPAEITAEGRIGEPGEPGTPFLILGRILGPDGAPATSDTSAVPRRG